VIHLDHLFWRPGWIETPRDEWVRIVERRTSSDRWIADGNYGGTLDIRFRRADTVIILAPATWRCTLRVMRRTLTNLGREVQAEGCPEHIDLKFWRWVWRYPKDSRPRLDAKLEPFRSSVRVIELHTEGEVQRFLASVDQ
jgi:adenylate kinase family enzyme